jgi:hypothetical protein
MEWGVVQAVLHLARASTRAALGAAAGGRRGAGARAPHCGGGALPQRAVGDAGRVREGDGGAARPERAPNRRAQAFVPSDDQTSILVRTRAITSSVNSVVEAWPPRSGVRTPDAVASSTLS